MSLVELTIDEMASEKHTLREQAAGQYLELLQRDQEPKPGDEKSLQRVLAALGRSPADLPADLEAVRRLVALRALAGEVGVRQARKDEARERQRKLDGEYRRAKEKVDSVFGEKLAAAKREVVGAQLALGEAQRASVDLGVAELWLEGLVRDVPADVLARKRDGQEFAERLKRAAPAQPTRDEVLAGAVRDFGVRGLVPLGHSVREDIDRRLLAAGYDDRLSDHEWASIIKKLPPGLSPAAAPVRA